MWELELNNVVINTEYLQLQWSELIIHMIMFKSNMKT